jgi:hypothetical protein
LLLITQLGGLYIVHYLQWVEIRQEIKHQLKNSLPQEELTKIIVTPAQALQLQWTRQNEFSYKGKMYDVVRKTKTDSVITFLCISDEKEDELFKNLENLVNNELGEKSKEKNTSKKASYFFQLFCNTSDNEQYMLDGTDFTFSLFTESFYIIPGLKLFAPPPENLC